MEAAAKEKLFYSPINGIALIEFEIRTGAIYPIKVHEINFAERVYSHRKEIKTDARAIDKTFVSGEQQQKLIKLSQELCFSRLSQTEPMEVIEKDYFLVIHFIPIGKQNPIGCELYLNQRLEKKGKIRELFESVMNLEKKASELR